MFPDFTGQIRPQEKSLIAVGGKSVKNNPKKD
jgi:hypothetical protein